MEFLQMSKSVKIGSQNEKGVVGSKAEINEEDGEHSEGIKVSTRVGEVLIREETVCTVWRGVSSANIEMSGYGRENNTVSDMKLGYHAERNSSESEYTSESDCDAGSDSDFELDESMTESGDECAAELREISLVDHQFISNPNKSAIGFSDLVILPIEAYRAVEWAILFKMDRYLTLQENVS